MEGGHTVERRKELEMVFLGDEKKITIASFGSMYPNDDELYLRDLQLNFLAVSSNNIHYECKGRKNKEKKRLKIQRKRNL